MLSVVLMFAVSAPAVLTSHRLSSNFDSASCFQITSAMTYARIYEEDGRLQILGVGFEL